MIEIIRVFTILTLVVVWALVSNELIEIVCIAIAIFETVVLAILVLAIELAKGKRQKATILTFFLSSIFVLLAVWMRHEVTVAADEFAKQFIAKYTCRPTLSELEANGEGWERKYPSMVEKTFKRAGASRTIIYRDMGLLRYGFLYEEKRSYVFPECK